MAACCWPVRRQSFLLAEAEGKHLPAIVRLWPTLWKNSPALGKRKIGVQPGTLGSSRAKSARRYFERRSTRLILNESSWHRLPACRCCPSIAATRCAETSSPTSARGRIVLIACEPRPSTVAQSAPLRPGQTAWRNKRTTPQQTFLALSAAAGQARVSPSPLNRSIERRARNAPRRHRRSNRVPRSGHLVGPAQIGIWDDSPDTEGDGARS
jgi:hypothetical protein